MVRLAIGFFVIALISFVLGLNSFAGVSIEVGKMLLVVFLILSVISLIVGIASGKKPNLPT